MVARKKKAAATPKKAAAVKADAAPDAPVSASPVAPAPKDEVALRTDGPTLAEFVKAGYSPEDYPAGDSPEQGSEFKPAPGRFPAE